MEKIATRHSLALISAMAGLTFRPMNANDFAAFAGAQADAQIAFGGEALASAICDITGESIMTEGGDAIAVIISGSTIEFSALTIDFEPVAIALNLEALG